MEGPDWVNLGDPLNVVRIVGILIPLLTAVLTRVDATRRLKALVTLVLSVLAATIGVLVAADGSYDWAAFVNAFVNTFVPAIAAYYGLWKPTGVTANVQVATKGVGMGPSGAVRRDPRNQSGAFREPLVTIGLLLVGTGLVIMVLDLLDTPLEAPLWLWLMLLVIGIILAAVGHNRRRPYV